MKSFGVKLAAGAVTILFGAYAAALAQKDRQDDSDSWNAEAPALAESASPIAGMADGSWVSQPETDLNGGAAADDLQGPPTSFQPSLQLVQHTDSVASDDISELPSFAAAPPTTRHVGVEGSVDDAPAQDWALPDAESTPSFNASGPAISMSFPGVPAGDARVGDARVGDAASEPAVAVNAGQTGERRYREDGDNVIATPAIEFYSAEQMTTDGETLQRAGQDPAPGDTPANLLRGAPGEFNSLRSPEADADPNADQISNVDQLGGGPDLAFEMDSPQTPGSFGQPAAPWESGASVLQSDPPSIPVGGTAARLGSPQPQNGPGIGGVASDIGGAQVDGLEQPGFAAAPERTASLPRDAGRSIDGMQNDYQPASMTPPGSAVAIDPAATLDSPGERRLEGAQTPSIVIQKRAPAEVKVGKPAAFVVHVQNVGSVEALNVEVHDRVPAGMRLIDASPSPLQQGTMLMWELGAMPAGDERTITMQLLPEQEGELGSVARVSFEAAASVRTISTRPELKIVQRVPEQGVLIGQQLEIELEVSNPGSGAATGVVLQEDVPEGLEHPKGRQLDNAIGTLAPGEVRRQVLRMRAVAPGIVHNTIRLMGDDGLVDENTVAIQVVAPDVQIELSGPSKRFLERQATYQLQVANNGTADATNIEISVMLDRGFTFVSTDYEGQYDPNRHAVFWSLAQLPAGAQGSVPLTLLPVEAGEQAIKIEARADLGIVARSERTMTVEGFAQLSFAISNAGGPIEVGAMANYEIVVTNSGSKPDSNVRVQVQLPPELELVSTDDGAAGTDGRGLVAFPPHAQLAPGEEFRRSLRVRGLAAGTHIVRASVVSEQSNVPVTKEDSTRVYSDE